MPAPVRLETNEAHRPEAQAISLALKLLSKAGTPTWAQFLRALKNQTDKAVQASQAFDLTDAQISLIEQHQNVIGLVDTEQKIMPVICQECGSVFFIGPDQSSAPKTCQMTSRCAGATVKPAAAKPVKPAVGE